MELKKMYPPQKDSPTTFLLGDIAPADTFIVVGNAAILPQTVPFPLTIGVDKTITEMVVVTNMHIGSGQLTVTRGEGAMAWLAGTSVARVFNASDLTSLQENITGINTEVNKSKSDIVGLENIIGDEDSGLIKDLADEVSRAKAAELTLTTEVGTKVPNTRTVNSKQLNANIVLTAADVNAVPTTRKVNNKPLSDDISLSASDVNAVPTTRKVNNKALSADITLSASDFTDVVPTTRKVNNKALSADITLVAADITDVVPNTRTVNSKQLNANIVLTAADVNAVPTTRKVNNKALSADITLSASDFTDVVPTTRKVNNKALSADITLVAADITDVVPNTRTVNGKALSANISLTSSDVGAVPTTRTVNGKALSSDITLAASDVGATTTAVAASLTVAGWSGSGPYTQNVAIAGMTTSKNSVVGLPSTATAAERESARNAILNPTAVAANQITITADGDKPAIAIPISVIMMP